MRIAWSKSIIYINETLWNDAATTDYLKKQNETEKHYFQVIQMTQVIQGSIDEYGT